MAQPPPDPVYIPQAVSSPPDRQSIERELRRISVMLLNLRDRIEKLEGTP